MVTTFLYLRTAELQYGAVEFRYWSTKFSRIENKCSFVRRENIYGLEKLVLLWGSSYKFKKPKSQKSDDLDHFWV